MDYSADLVPEICDGKSLGELMAGTCEKGAGILILRAAIGNQEIIEALSVRKDLRVDDVATYDTAYTQQLVVDETWKIHEAGDRLCRIYERVDGSRI